MNAPTQHSPDSLPSLQAFLDRSSALELAKRSLIGAPVYTVISLIMVFGTPFLRELGWLVIAEAALLILLGVVRVLFALGFPARYARLGEKAVVQFSILTAIQSLTLGVLAGIVIWQYWETQETVLTIVLSAGCIAAGTSALSVRHSAHLIFLACVLGPLGVAVFLVGGLTKALLIVGFLVLMAFLVQDGGQARSVYLKRLKDHYDDQLNRRRVAVENEARRQFLADVGHEIRTPINSIIGVTSLLEQETMSERARGYVGLVQQSGKALLDVVENIPGSVRTRTDTETSQTGQLDLYGRVAAATDLYRSKAEDKGLTMELDFDAPVSVMFADETHLEQVLANLLSNAVGFTENGSISVRVSAEALGDGELMLHFAVSDTGPGIPAERIPTLFNPFSSQGAKTSGRYGGGGLGLPTCKGLVELMGGEILVESEEGQGTTVRFSARAETDPADESWSAPEESRQTEPPLAERHPHRILVVDDHQVHRQILCAMLSRLGYQADEAADGEEAVAAAMQGGYDMIFMDLRMPRLNGMEAAGWIREHFGQEDALRIVALTGDALKETRRAALRSGMDDFLPKPVQIEDLKRVLKGAGDSGENGLL